MGRVFDSRYGVNPPKKKLNPQLFTRTDVQDSSLKRDAVPVATVSASDPRTRAAKVRCIAEEVDRPLTEHDAVRLWNQSAAEEKVRHRQAIAEREERERKQREHDERVRQAHIDAATRDAEIVKRNAEEKAKLLEFAKLEIARLTEQNLVASQISATCEALGCTLDEARVVGQRLRAQGTHMLPFCWERELEKLRSESK